MKTIAYYTTLFILYSYNFVALTMRFYGYLLIISPIGTMIGLLIAAWLIVNTSWFLTFYEITWLIAYFAYLLSSTVREHAAWTISIYKEITNG